MKINVNNTSVYYEKHGEGTPLLILAGFMLDHEVMKGAIEPLFAERTGWQRIYVDMPGTGYTRAGDDIMTSADIVALLCDFIDLVIPGEFALLGFSYGGLIARAILKAKQAQVNGLVLLAPVVSGANGERDIPEGMIIAHDPDATALLPEQLAPMILSTLSVQTMAVIERIMREYGATFQRADMSFLQQLRQPENYHIKAVDTLETPFDKPVLILTGRHDTSVGFADAFTLARSYPRATYATLDRAGHGVYIEQDRLYQALMQEWFDRVEEAVSVELA